MAQGECHECGAAMEIAIWDSTALSGAAVMICNECHDSVPEHTLWDVSNIDTSRPSMPNSHPLDEGEKWTIHNRYADFDSYITHLEASWDGVMPEDVKDEIEIPEEDCWEIFVHSVEDEDAIMEAREALEEQIGK